MASRDIPVSTRLAVLHGHPVQQFGWLFAGFGLVFCLLFVPATDISFLDFRGPTSETAGRIVAVEATSYSEGGGRHGRGSPIQRCEYEWSDAQGVVRRGESYTLRSGLAPGATVRVEHLRDDPDRSRIVGMRRAPFQAWALFVLIFPAAGFAFVFWARRMARRQLHALERGEMVQAQVLGAVARPRSKGRTSWTLQLRVPAEGEPHELHELATLQASTAVAGTRLVVLAAGEPRKECFLLSDIPCKPRFTPDGLRVEAVPVSAVVLRLLLPAVVFVELACALLFL